jgi:DNA repair exonuclease SbcCD nuclease subunit
VFTSGRIECVELPQARIWGAGFTENSSRALLDGFEAAKDGDKPDIMVIHGDVGSPASVYNPISEDELARSGMDYVALGHIHAYSGLLRAGETFYAYPGCAEGRGFDECGEKGVILAEVSCGDARATLVPLGGRKYRMLDVALGAGEDPVSAVNAALDGDTSRDIYRITFTGECDEAPDLRAAMRELEGKFFSLQLRDRTVLRRDLWEKCGEDTLRGLFLTRLRREYDAAQSDEEREKITLAARYGLAALDNGEGPAL